MILCISHHDVYDVLTDREGYVRGRIMYEFSSWSWSYSEANLLRSHVVDHGSSESYDDALEAISKRCNRTL